MIDDELWASKGNKSVPKIYRDLINKLLHTQARLSAAVKHHHLVASCEMTVKPHFTFRVYNLYFGFFWEKEGCGIHIISQRTYTGAKCTDVFYIVWYIQAIVSESYLPLSIARALGMKETWSLLVLQTEVLKRWPDSISSNCLRSGWSWQSSITLALLKTCLLKMSERLARLLRDFWPI